jgi:hypothetical protein
MFNEIRQKVPAIMIIDSGLTWEEPGLGGGLERTSVLNGNWQGWYRIFARVNVVVAAVTHDPESSSMLQNMLSIFFKQLRNEAGGSAMRSGRPGDNWEVRLPLNFTSTTAAGQNIADDPKDQLWASTIELELQAEDLFVIERPIVQTIVDGGVVNEPDLRAANPPIIEAPDTVRVRDGSFMVVIHKLNDNHGLVIDRPDIATIDPEYMMITPHRTGTLVLSVMDRTQHQNAAPAPWAQKAVATKTVIVTV